VLVLRGSPVHYLLVRANRYTGRVGLVNNIDDAVRQLRAGVGRKDHIGDDDDADGGDVVLLTDAAVADHIARQVYVSLLTLLTRTHSIYPFPRRPEPGSDVNKPQNFPLNNAYVLIVS